MRNIYINSILITLAIIQISTFTTHYHGYTKNSRRRTISLSSAVLESSTSKNNRSFHQRMRNLVSPVKKPTSNKRRLKNMYVAHTLEDYKLLVGDEKDQIVIVRFFATWCKVCLFIKSTCLMIIGMSSNRPIILSSSKTISTYKICTSSCKGLKCGFASRAECTFFTICAYLYSEGRTFGISRGDEN